MKIESIKIKNFRGYKEEKQINFDNLTLIVGKNDIGKSTILEAADIFFGNRNPDKDDLNINCDKENDKIEIFVEFSNFPSEIDIDAGAKTSLSEEFLLNFRSNLEIKKVFTPGSKTPKVFIIANLPKKSECLITLKNNELKAKAKDLGIDAASYNASINNTIRKAIWNSQDKSAFEERAVDIFKEDGKKIYEKLELEFPVFTLFSADRKNTDQDDEIQAPMRSTIKELIMEISSELEPIRKKILERLDKVSEGTIKKLSEMNPEVANTLKSIADKPAWEKAFTVNIESDGIPLNKRGSGVKRLVLISYFRQEAERKRGQENKINVFYAIEEPETSQHPDWQMKLFDAFNELTSEDGVQIAITCHHPELCGLVELSKIRFVQKVGNEIVIREGDENNYKEISNTLGVLPKLDGVKVIVGVEGPNDVEFLKNISHKFEVDGENPAILWIPMGGGTLRDYVEKGYLDKLKLPQIYFADRDIDSKYKDNINILKEKGHWAELTEFLTMENYLHPKYYSAIWPDLKGTFVDLSSTSWLETWKERNIKKELFEFINTEFVNGNSKLKNYGAGKIKNSIAQAAVNMTTNDFQEMDTFDEFQKLFNEINKYL